jgi:alpha-tubulin suppressor-like RCC1 family protein
LQNPIAQIKSLMNVCFTKIDAGEVQCLALTDDGRLYALVGSDRRQLGLGDDNPELTRPGGRPCEANADP